ncbi:MAG: LysM peptidoglycan-binding domain-containing protein [Desulfarculus sp.]|nr:LysM peptidoglycan-binding domain-containing protein [Desulfarculus sp.]
MRPGETLGGLARRYKVSENDIVRWNSMGTRRLLLKGESLVIYPGQNS